LESGVNKLSKMGHAGFEKFQKAFGFLDEMKENYEKFINNKYS
jgi:hypothetical protein